MKTKVGWLLVTLCCVTGLELKAQSQSQLGLGAGRATILQHGLIEPLYTYPSTGLGAFYHYQWKGRHRAHSPWGVLVGLDYHRVNHEENFRGTAFGFPPERVSMQFSTLLLRTALVANANSSRGQRMQVYFHLGTLLLHDFASSATYHYHDRPDVTDTDFRFFSPDRRVFFNIYTAVDLRYQLGKHFFVGLYGQLSTTQLGSNLYSRQTMLSTQLTAGRFIRKVDERAKFLEKQRELQF